MSDPCSPPPIRPIEDLGCQKDSNATSARSWRGKDETAPFIDRRNCYYSIVIDRAWREPGAVNNPLDQYERRGYPFDGALWPTIQYNSFGAFSKFTFKQHILDLGDKLISACILLLKYKLLSVVDNLINLII